MHKESDLVYQILRILKVGHTDLFLNQLYEEHPHKYNLFGLSRILKEYGIDNEGYKFADKEILEELEVPFVAQYHHLLVIVVKLTSTHVYYYVNGKEFSVATSEFKEKWSGVTLLIGDHSQAIEPEYKSHRLKENYSSLLYAVLTLSLFLVPLWRLASLWPSITPGIIVLLILNAVGAYIGYLLVLKQIKIHSASADKICSIFKQSDCNNVLESKASKLWGIIGWSEAGLSYFSSNLIILIFFPSLLPYLSLINVGVLPYSIWSIWYQKTKAKQWCALCLIVQLLFYCIFACNLLSGFIRLPDFKAIELASVAWVYIIPFCLISVLLPIIAKSLQVGNLKHEFNKLKMAREVFDGLLYANNRYEVKDASKIVFGNPEAKNQITLVSNPHCQPCATTHEKIEKLLEHLDEYDICIRFLFLNFNLEIAKDSGKFLIAAYLREGPTVARQIFYRWFAGEKYTIGKTYAKYSFDLGSSDVIEEQRKHELWSKQTHVHQTPTVILNGYILPEIYTIDDIPLLV